MVPATIDPPGPPRRIEGAARPSGRSLGLGKTADEVHLLWRDPSLPPTARALGLRARSVSFPKSQTVLLEEVRIMSLFTWLRPWKATSRRARTGRARRAGFRPSLELLEGRLTPSHFRYG